MPFPPERGLLTRPKFIVNYMLAGCTPPFDLVVRFSQQPREDLLQLLFGFSAFDVVQAMFEPRHSRRRKPARHGRKRPLGRGFPDVNDLWGERMRADEVADAARKLPGFTYAFRVLNVVEGFSFATALVDGIQDLGYETLWGIFNVEQDHCKEFERISRQNEDGQIVGAGGLRSTAISVPKLDFSNGFTSGPFGCTCWTTDYAVNIAANAWNDAGSFPMKGYLQLHSGERGELGRSKTITLNEGERGQLECSASFYAGENCRWSWISEGNNGILQDTNIIGYGESGWLDWVPSAGFTL